MKDIYIFLKNPGDWNIKKGTLIRKIVYLFIFLITGYYCNNFYPFPYFWGFTICFLIIGSIALWCILQFSMKMNSISAITANQSPVLRANGLYHSCGQESVIYIIVPCMVVLFFGIGGCSMFGAIQINITLFWVLLLFSIVVYISIVGYLQYIVLAIYIGKIAMSSGDYKNIRSIPADCIPSQLGWLQELTKLYHIYRTAFFTVGSAYIIAFGAFCWLPDLKADTSLPAFFLLWGTITIAVVLVFPIISYLEYIWIKKIVSKLKQNYLKELAKEGKVLINKSHENNLAKQNYKLMESMYAIQIINSNDYPIKSAWSTGYTICLSAFNFFSSIVTVLQGMSMLSIFPLHIP